MISPSDLLELPLDERLKCMEVLWDSLREAEPDSPGWHGEVLAERRAKIESGEAKFISGNELKKRLQR
ncbi:MAG: addiction module component CHP02574 family protein [Verrucomicrobiales bacterium]|nr:addiction module component CHP02574 family protein [Verrucomicrobiales bacterium]